MPATATRKSGTGRLLPVLLLFLAAGPAASAQQRDVTPIFEPGKAPVQSVREPARANADRSVDRIVQDIEKKYRAKVVRQESREDEGRKVLVLRLYNDKDGRVWTVRVDQVSGKEL